MRKFTKLEKKVLIEELLKLKISRDSIKETIKVGADLIWEIRKELWITESYQNKFDSSTASGFYNFINKTLEIKTIMKWFIESINSGEIKIREEDNPQLIKDLSVFYYYDWFKYILNKWNSDKRFNFFLKKKIEEIIEIINKYFNIYKEKNNISSNSFRVVKNLEKQESIFANKRIPTESINLLLKKIKKEYSKESLKLYDFVKKTRVKFPADCVQIKKLNDFSLETQEFLFEKYIEFKKQSFGIWIWVKLDSVYYLIWNSIISMKKIESIIVEYLYKKWLSLSQIRTFKLSYKTIVETIRKIDSSYKGTKKTKWMRVKKLEEAISLLKKWYPMNLVRETLTCDSNLVNFANKVVNWIESISNFKYQFNQKHQ